MALGLTAILVLGVAGLLYAALLPARARGWALLAGSVVAIYWLQPRLPIRFSDFILPTATLGVTAVSWRFTRPADDRALSGDDRRTLALMLALVLALSLFRYVDAVYRLTASRPPHPLWLLTGLALAGTAVLLLHRLAAGRGRRRVLTGGILVLVALFVLLKTPALATAVSRWWRAAAGQDVSLAAPLDLNWLGFSYVAFRLLHTFRDRQTGQLPDLSLREYVTYVIFAPAYIAGPIDRAERFAADLRALPGMAGLDPTRFTAALARISLGLFKKFVIADSLALFALDPVRAAQVTNTPGLWLLLYGYAFRLYLDFAGYTDIAIGLGLLFGIRLPENFQRPYRTTNLAAFWQSWHITLSNWARFYVFSPLSRALLRRKPRPSPTLIVLSTQMATMVVIGLWHGVTLNFLIWGVWHGLGLFVHKQWSDRTRRWYRELQQTTWRRRGWTAVSWFITFHYVVLGWVWFVLPDVRLAAQTMLRLLGRG